MINQQTMGEIVQAAHDNNLPYAATCLTDETGATLAELAATLDDLADYVRGLAKERS
jgi:hypothetical protein